MNSHNSFLLIGFRVSVGRSVRAVQLLLVIHLHSYYAPLRLWGVAISHLRVVWIHFRVWPKDWMANSDFFELPELPKWS